MQKLIKQLKEFHIITGIKININGCSVIDVSKNLCQSYPLEFKKLQELLNSQNKIIWILNLNL